MTQNSSLDAQIERKIRNSFARQAMMQTLAAELGALSPGRVQILAPILPQTHQQHGFAHAAVTFALGDSAAGYAALSLMDADCEVLTSEMKINLLAPADGESLRAEGHVIRAGRRLVVVGATVIAIKDGQETDIAVLQGTMVPIR